MNGDRPRVVFAYDFDALKPEPEPGESRVKQRRKYLFAQGD